MTLNIKIAQSKLPVEFFNVDDFKENSVFLVKLVQKASNNLLMALDSLQD